MRSVTIRPAPEGVVAVAVALPVSRNRPGGAPSSTAQRTWSQICGKRCDSSNNTVPGLGMNAAEFADSKAS